MFQIFEHKSRPLAPRATYLRRLASSTSVGLFLIALSLGAGMIGYHELEGLAWIDAYTNAAMLLSGMGPLTSPSTPAGKLFAGAYALYSGFAVLGIAGVMLAPVVHRMMHAFHIDSRTR